MIKSVLYGFVVLCLIIVGFLTYQTYAIISKPMLADDQAPLIIDIKPHSSAHEVVDILYAQKLIPSKRFFLQLINFEGLSHRIKAGVYQVKAKESAQEFLSRIVAGDVLVLPFQIIEGSTVQQISTHLTAAPYLTYQPEDWSVLGQDKTAEGLLLADTYNYDAGSSAKNILQTAHAKLQAYLDKAWASRSPGLPYKNAYELLIAASILEKETALPKERALIAGVIVNRLKKHMPLQMDPTVIYALGAGYTGKLSHSDLSIDSPYNTYRYPGLPIAPIAMVGKLAIDAAAHPTPSDYLYFVAKGDGSHQFSKTYDAQKSAIQHYLLKANP